jgi:hypothetical protein
MYLEKIMSNSFNDLAIRKDAQIQDLQKELARIETELDVESTMESACIRFELEEYEETKGIGYTDGFIDGWNRCMESLADYQKRSSKKYKELESLHPEWFLLNEFIW